MADIQMSGIVASISPTQSSTNVRFGGQVVVTQGPITSELLLEYDHPGYSSIFALLMASAVNKKPIYVDATPNGPTFGGMVSSATIQWVNFEFMS